MQMVAPAFMDYVLNDRIGVPLGNQHPGAAAAPHGVFPCTGEDRWISIVVVDDEEWAGLRRALGDPEWAGLPEFSDLAGRLRHIEDLHDRLAERTAECNDRELAERLQEQGVAAAPVLCVGDLLEDPHWKARNTFIEVRHPLGFDETIYGAYVKTSRSEAHVEPGPAMGQHNERVCRELIGLSEQRYRDLIERRVIY